jgi:hypothetical protein
MTLQQRLRIHQIARVEALRKPAIHRSQQFARLLHLALVAPEALCATDTDESRLSLQCKIQTSCGFFPESHFPQITGVFVGVSLYFVE